MNGLKKAGFFVELAHGDPNGPRLADCVGRLGAGDAGKIVAYLKSGVPLAVAPGLTHDVLSTDRTVINGLRIYTDGVWAWPSDLWYYASVYKAALPDAFLDHMKAMDWSVPAVDVSKFMPEG